MLLETGGLLIGGMVHDLLVVLVRRASIEGLSP
jgi:hypothetical protein